MALSTSITVRPSTPSPAPVLPVHPAIRQRRAVPVNFVIAFIVEYKFMFISV